MSRFGGPQNENKPGFFSRIKGRLTGSFAQLVPYLLIAVLASSFSIYFFAPNAPRGQLVMIAEVFLAIGLTLGYMAGAQIDEEETRQ